MAKILFLVAHPDDVEVCAGGTLAKHIDNNDSVYVLICFMPNNNDRLLEFHKAADYIGYTPLSLGEEVKQSHRFILESIEEIINPFEISRVYITHVGDSHQEHRVVAKIGMSYCRDNVSDLIMLQPAIPGGMTHKPFIPNMYVNIDKHIEDKKELIKIHQSQIEKYSIKRDWIDAIVSRDRANGQLIHCQYAEAFEIVKMIDRGL